MTKNKTITKDIVYFMLVIVFAIGLILGYAWRVAQVKSIERDIIQSLTNCEQLITDELVISPEHGCRKYHNAVISLRSQTFNY